MFDSSPVLAAILPWLHGGWKTFDHRALDSSNGSACGACARTCFMFYLAAACWKAAAAARLRSLSWYRGRRCSAFKPNEKELMATATCISGGPGAEFFDRHCRGGLLRWICKVRVCVRIGSANSLCMAIFRGQQNWPVPNGKCINLGMLVVATAMILPACMSRHCRWPCNYRG